MKRSDINPMPAFFDRYINLVEDIDLLEGLRKYAPAEVYREIEKMKLLGDRVYQPGKWTTKDILQHVIDTERVMSYRALCFSRKDTTPLPGFDEEIFGANTLAIERSVDDLLDEFMQVRTATISLFRYMNDEMLLRKGTAYKTEISPLALGFVIIRHPVHHMNVLRERYFPLLVQ